ncbi:MAG: restriction endonuclease subunit S, partial [Pseudomonadota bacterium]
RSGAARSYFYLYSKQSTNLASISSSNVMSCPLPLPPAEEQFQILSFLNHETARIDALVEEQQRLIELLKEKRQAVISHAVTKGLDPDVPMKDSGVEWLGEVPVYWDVLKLGYLTTSQGGGTPPKDELQYWNGSIPWVTPKDMKMQWITSTVDTISEAALYVSPVSMIDPESVLIVFRSGILRHRIPVAINKVPVTVNQDMRAYNVRPRLLPDFFLRLIQGLNNELLSEWSKQGATVESLDSELVSSSQIPVPPWGEQKAIAAFLDDETTRIDALVKEAESVINLLQERRSALISAAVTGKIDVRGWQADQQSRQSEILMAAETRATYG